jgi:predicted nuclease of predicted toxin-antitoxin system
MEGFFKKTVKNREFAEVPIEKPKLKEGVDFVFEQNPELAKIGTKEQYSEYLDTIFPDTMVKDVVFHGTAQKEKIEAFNFNKSNFANAVFFTKDYNFAKSFAFDDVRDGSVQAQMVNIQNSFNFSEKNHIQELRVIIQQLVTEGYRSENTGITFRNNLPSITIGERVIENPVINDYVDHYMWRLENGSWRIIETDRIIDFIAKKYDSILVNEKGVTNIAVFNQDQIHVLGSKNDLDKFTEFVF